MRIGIVTQPLQGNYGGLMQAWALQQSLRQIGHTPITFDFNYCTPLFRHCLSLSKSFIMRLLGYNRPYYKRIYNKRDKLFEEFISKNISISEQIALYSPELIDNYDLDAVITGSDQVWRPCYNPLIEDMYLRFVRKKEVIKLAYAASFGVDNWEYNKLLTNKCRKHAQQIDAISVREKSGVELCNKYLGGKAMEVLDPTLLHTSNEYESLCYGVPKRTTNFLASYVLDMTPEKEIYINKVAKEKGLEVLIYRAGSNASLSVEEWLAIYRDAKFIVTDSFHGTVFSIIFNKPFIAIGNSERGISRFVSLLEKIDLQSLLICDLNIIPSLEIDWENVNMSLNNYKSKSLSFLRDNLV